MKINNEKVKTGKQKVHKQKRIPIQQTMYIMFLTRIRHRTGSSKITRELGKS